MSIELSRRDFMKCSAVAVLAAASGSLLTGCGGGGTGGYTAGQTANRNGIAVTMGSYQFQGGLGPGLGNFEVLKIEFAVENKGETSQKIANTPGDYLDGFLAVIAKISSSSPESLKNLSNFSVTAEGGKVYTYLDFNDIRHADLAPGQRTTVTLYCAVTPDWKSLKINYKKLGLNFIQYP